MLCYCPESPHIVGGGTQSQMLSQFTTKVVGRQVITGPAKATAMGNLLMQMIAPGHTGSLAERRQVVRNSSGLLSYEPGVGSRWEA